MIRSTIDRWEAGTLRLLCRIMPVAAAALCAGCGLAGTAVATGTGAAVEVQQAQQAKQMEDRVKRELDQAQQSAAQQRNDAESQGK
jgi:Na+-translocating ferredoxin:NAD+ oxidoreductase RNF subunit RnfB